MIVEYIRSRIAVQGFRGSPVRTSGPDQSGGRV